MKLTNKMGLPEALVAAVANDDYDRGECDYSVTELLSPPRISALRRLHEHELTEDASSRIWSLLGQCAHAILERAGGASLSEWRGHVTIAGKRVSGQLDTLNVLSGTLSDWKVTTAWTVKGGALRDEWPPQLNAYAMIARSAGHDIKRLEIVAILRDWSKLEARRSADYPQQQVAVIPVPVWPEAEVRRLFDERIRLHESARAGELPICTPEERWQRPTVYAVMKDGRKSALRLLDSHEEAEGWIKANEKGGEKIVERPGENVRCANYCPVSAFCSWWAAHAPAPEERPAMLASLPF